jgi:hypothetical protein
MDIAARLRVLTQAPYSLRFRSTPRAPRKSYAPPADDEDYEPDPDEARAPPRPPKKRRTPSAGACGAWARGGGGSADIGDTSVVHAALTLLRMAAA